MDHAILTERLALVSRDSRLAPSLVEHLGRWIRTAPDEELFQLDVFDWAKQHGTSDEEALDLFLHAAKAGIFELKWGVLCPFCGMLLQTPGGLRALGPNPHCRMCRVSFPASADDQIQVTFSLEPGIRKLRYYDPEGLDPIRDVMKMFYSPTFEPLVKPQDLAEVLRAGVALRPGDSGVLRGDITRGLATVFSPNVHAVAFLHPTPGGSTEVELEIHDGAMLPAERAIGPGPVALHVTNRTNYHVSAFLLDFPDHPSDHSEPPPPLAQIRPYLTGKRVLTSQTFRDLFRTETIGENGLSIKNLAMVFTDLQASTALYERVGDIRALELVRSHFEKLNEVVRRHRGAIVKTIGDAVMAVFGDPERAIGAAAGMNRAVRKIDADGETLALKIGVHAGSCIAIQTNHQIDYFGSAVNVAARVQGVAAGGEIVVTDTIWNAPGVQGLVEDFGLEATPDRVDLRGIAMGVSVYRLS